MTSRVGKILIVDDEPENCFVVSKALEEEGYVSVVAYSGLEALEQIDHDSQIQLVLLDIRMPGMDGVEVLSRIREKNQDLPVVIVSAFEHVSTAVKCMRLGAYDYLTKPLNIHELKITVSNSFRTLSLQNEVVRLKGEIDKGRGLENLVGTSGPMQKTGAHIRKVSPYDISVLITGESGTGKEVVAEAIHALSPRRDKPFVAVDCTALPEHLVESELFGYEKGAFTGATERKTGRFEQAHGGTLFLDEIGNLPAQVQMKLLRVLQERQITRLGGKKPFSVDVRVLAATNADLNEMMRKGGFREDLYHRLNEFSIYLPPLRDRLGDVELLAIHFLQRFNLQFKKNVTGFQDEVLELFRRYAWPGNVRELNNAVKRAVVMADTTVELSHLAPELRQAKPLPPPPSIQARAAKGEQSHDETGDPVLEPLKVATQRAVARIEVDLIRAALVSTKNNKVQAAKILCIDYKTLFNKLKEHHLEA